MNEYKILISGSYNVFNEGWNGAGIYMCSGLYQSSTFKLPIYIGSACDLNQRIKNTHIYHLNKNQHPHKNGSNISYAASGKRKTHGGYHWEYIN